MKVNSFENEGTFHLPSSPEDTFNGRVNVENGGSSSLVISFDDFVKLKLKEETILGKLNNNKFVYLEVNRSLLPDKINFNNLIKKRVNIKLKNLLISQSKIAAPKKSKKLSFSIFGLSNVDWDFNLDKNSSKQYEVCGDVKLEIRNNNDELGYEFILFSKRHIDTEKLKQLAKSVLSFICLCTMNSLSFTNYKIYADDNSNEIECYFSSIPFKDTNIFYNQNIILKPGDFKNDTFKNWIKIEEKTFPALELLVDSIFETNTYVELRFLSNIQSLEYFHRSLENKCERCGGDLTLNKRIKILMKPIMQILPYNSENRSNNFHKLVDIRNDLTHEGVTKNTEDNIGESLSIYREFLRCIYILRVLNELGYQVSELNKIVKSYPYYNWCLIQKLLNPKENKGD